MKAGDKMCIGIMDTRHFTFMATGIDRMDCESNMRKGWKAHAKEYDSDTDFEYFFEYFADDVAYFEIEIGDVMRDGDIIFPRERRNARC